MADVILAVATLVVAVTGLANVLLIGRARAQVSVVDAKVDAVHGVAVEVAHEVHTLNSLTLGQASDATESRRIEAIPAADRTAAEAHHVGDVPPD